MNTVTWMNEELASLALGKLETKDTMAIVQYVFALRSSGRGFKCLGVEYAICGYTPDVVLRSGNFTIVVECKNTKTTTGKKQLETYLRTLREADIPSLGILFSQRDINFYSIEPINTSLLGNARELVFDVLYELRTRGESFGTDHFSDIDRCGAVELEKATFECGFSTPSDSEDSNKTIVNGDL